ncbi:MAG: SUMF1/EgtB/PvdO family nonheme iron enzyme [Pseudomonadota bacterium]
MLDLESTLDAARSPDVAAAVDVAVYDAGSFTRWIGEACATSLECDYAGGLCLTEGFPDGLCSLGCTRLCPDSVDPSDPVTFCIADPVNLDQGVCVSRCDFSLFAGGCRQGYACTSRPRFSEASTLREVCLPPELIPDAGVAESGFVDAAACDPQAQVLPNAGLGEPAGQGGCAPGMALTNLGALCMDRWEAFVVEVTNSGELDWSPYFNPGTRRIRAKSAPGAVPQGYITEIQAAAACLEAGKHLCSRTEWELACRGAAGNSYPYGSTRQDGLCNDARSVHPAIEYFGTSDAWIWSELGNACLNQLHDGLARTGQHPGCVTSDGILDLMGNLHEWVDDPAGTFKGGFYVDTVINGEGCLYTTTAHDVSHWDYSTGFRCCATP